MYKQNPILYGYGVEAKIEDVLTSGYYKSPLGSNNVDCFVEEVIKSEKKMAFFIQKYSGGYHFDRRR